MTKVMRAAKAMQVAEATPVAQITHDIQAAQALIDLSALHHNLQRVHAAAPGCRVMAIIKADAYGHGLVRVARALSTSIAGFGVARLEEAMTLREAGITLPIILLEGFFEAVELGLISHHKLSVVVHHSQQIDLLERAAPEVPISAWVKVDSGMHRLGLPPQSVVLAWQRLEACRAVAKPIRLMTHLASADDRAAPLTLKQLACFNAAVAGIDAERSIANSAAILAWPQTHAEWLRPGLMLYGASPFSNGSGSDEGLKPVMTLRSKLIAVNHFKKGDTIGYGASWECPEDMPVGVVAIGYGDGYPRHAMSGTPVLLNGRRTPLIGRVSMDMICLDLRSQPQARVGDPVVLWGKGLPAEEVAASASTIPYELLCGVARRVKFIEIDGTG